MDESCSSIHQTQPSVGWKDPENPIGKAEILLITDAEDASIPENEIINRLQKDDIKLHTILINEDMDRSYSAGTIKLLKKISESFHKADVNDKGALTIVNTVGKK